MWAVMVKLKGKMARMFIMQIKINSLYVILSESFFAFFPMSSRISDFIKILIVLIVLFILLFRVVLGFIKSGKKNRKIIQLRERVEEDGSNMENIL